MKRIVLFLLAAVFAIDAFGGDWKNAEPGWQYHFPRDHHSHGAFKTEWWYFTGNLFDTEGRRFGYEVTFFRQGIRPQADRDPTLSRFIVDDLKFAHFAFTDIDAQRFQFEQKTSRGAFGEAGFDDGQRLAWIDDWSLRINGDNEFELKAVTAKGPIHVQLRAMKAPVVHGENGVSVKASAAGHASHYYSIPRLETEGEFVVDGKPRSLRGETWFDHEWASGQLAEGQAGWDWVCVQWENGTELMLYQMRLKNGEADSSSSGTWIAADGKTVHLRSSDFRMTPLAFWKSDANGAQYPIEWQVTVPEERMDFVIRATVRNQELAIDPITYWEGAIDATGTRDGKAIKGRGYLELTGYAGRIETLKR